MLIFEFLACMGISVAAYYWSIIYADKATYLYNDKFGKPSDSGSLVIITNFFSAVCLNSTLIPISLIVSLEIAKLLQSWFFT
jgi:magnesium-transporting ATPase (P-type)